MGSAVQQQPSVVGSAASISGSPLPNIYRSLVSYTTIFDFSSCIKNLAVHNLSSRSLTPEETALLGLSLKFILPPPDTPNHTILDSFYRFARSVRLRYHNMSQPSSPPSLLSVPNPLYQPPPACPLVEQYLSLVFSRLTSSLSTHPVHYSHFPAHISNILTSLFSDDSIVIQAADKNLGVVVVDRIWYEAEAFHQLLDTTTYKQLDSTPPAPFFFDPLVSILDRHNKLYCERKPTSHSRLATFVLQRSTLPVKPAYVYFLIKIHKNPVTGRPICSSVRTPLYHASKYVDRILQPVMRAAASYIPNSATLAARLNVTRFPPDCVFGTADITNLYPSIPTEAGLRALEIALRKAGFSSSDISLILDLAHLILTHNVMSFGNTIWLQLQGTAMGSPMAVTYASIYLTILELEIFAECQKSLSFRLPLLYYRFIDDLFYLSSIAADVRLFFTTFDGYHPTVRLTWDVNDHNGVFLDSESFKGPEFTHTGLLDIRIYQKPINSYLYIPPTSFHQRSMFSSFISAELRRFRILCSRNADFLPALASFYSRLLARGYDAEFLYPLFARIPTREQLLQPFLICRLQQSAANHLNSPHTTPSHVTSIVDDSTTLTGSSSSPLALSVPFSYRTAKMHLSRIIHIPQHIRDSTLFDLLLPEQRQPLVSYRRAANLRDLLVPSAYQHTVIVPDPLPT